MRRDISRSVKTNIKEIKRDKNWAAAKLKIIEVAEIMTALNIREVKCNLDFTEFCLLFL